MPFDIAGARKAGYSDSEIADFLAPSSNFDVGAARKSGYDDSEIVGYLAEKASKTPSYLETMARQNEANALEGGATNPKENAEQGEYVARGAIGGVINLVGTGAKVFGDAYNDLFGLSREDAQILGVKQPRTPGKFLEDTARGLQSKVSDITDNAPAGAKEKYDALEYMTADPQKSALLSPTRVTRDLLLSMPSTLALMLTARFGGKSAQIAYDDALTAGLSEEAAKKAAIEAAMKTTTRVGAGSEGVLGYGQQATQVEEQVNKLPRDKIEKSPEYQALIKQGKTPEVAQQIVASRAGTLAGFLAGTIDAATNLASGPVLGKVIGEGGSLLSRSAKGAATESIQEGVQSGGEQVGSNYAEQRFVDPSKNLSDDVGENIVQGAVLGGLTGAAAAGGFGHSTESEADNIVNNPPAAGVDQYLQHRENEQSGTIGDFAPGKEPPVAPNPKGWEFNSNAEGPVMGGTDATVEAAPPPASLTPDQKVSVDKVLGADSVDTAIAAAAETAVSSPTGAPRASLDQIIDETKKSLDENLPDAQDRLQEKVDRLRSDIGMLAPLPVYTPTAGNENVSSVSPDLYKALNNHFSSYGLNVVVVDDSKVPANQQFDGIAHENQPNTVFISSNPSRAAAQVATHEIGHTFEELKLPDGTNLNQLLKQQVMEGLTGGAGAALELHSQTAPSRASFPNTPEGQAAHADAVLDHLYNEVGKDLVGDAPRFPGFVEKVAAAVEARYGKSTATSILGKLVQRIRETFNTLQKLFKPSGLVFDTHNWVSNLDQIHGTVAQMHAAKLGEANQLEDEKPAQTPEQVIAAAQTGTEAPPARVGPSPREGYETAKQQAQVYARWIRELDEKRRVDADKSPEVAALRAEAKEILGKVRGGEKYLTKTARSRLEKIRAEIEDRVNPKTDNNDMAIVRERMVEAHSRMADAAAVSKAKYSPKAANDEPVGEKKERLIKKARENQEKFAETPSVAAAYKAYADFVEGRGSQFGFSDLAQLSKLSAEIDRVSELAVKNLRNPGANVTSLPKRDHDAKITPSTIADEHEAEVASIIGTAKKDAKFSPKVEEKGPVFFSALERGVDAVKFDKAPPGQWLATIRNMPGIKAEEIQSTRIDKWLNAQTRQVTKAEVLEQLELNSVKIEEVQKGNESGPRALSRAKEFAKAAGFLEWNNVPASTKMDYVEQARNELGMAPTKFQKWVLPGGQNYRELLMTLPGAENTKLPPGWEVRPVKIPSGYGITHEVIDDHGTQRGLGTNEQDAINDAYTTNDKAMKLANERGGFRGSHWDEPNVLAHIRFDDRTGPNGETILHIAEIQSDWHQLGRRSGYNGQADIKELTRLGREATDAMYATRDRLIAKVTDGKYKSKTEALDAGDKEAFKKIQAVEQMPEMVAAIEKHEQATEALRRARSAVPDAPFKTTWHELAFKRALRYAAENGYDRISWDTGETNADRYDLSQTVSKITYAPSVKRLMVYNKDGWVPEDTDGEGGSEGDVILDRSNVELEALPGIIGKEAADKIAAMKHPFYRELEGNGLKVGGEGMKGFYDKILPNFVSKYVKKWGGKVENDTVGTAQDDHPWKAYEGDKFVARFPTEAAAKKWNVQWGGGHTIRYEPDEASAPVHSLDITPAMRAAVLQGQPKFSPKAKPTVKDLTKENPELKKVVRNLAPDEIDQVSQRTAERLVKLFTSLPSSEETAAVAYSGRAKRGWYKHSAQAIVDVFGQADGNRFAALLAALSPQTSVESNLENALKMWVNWNKAGRPVDPKTIGKLMGQSVQGTGGEASVLDAWRGNTIRALTDADPGRPDFMLSGPKVNSFAKNLRNEVNEVTNDAWMATYAAIEPEMLASRRLANTRDNVGKSFGFKSPGYVAMSAMVRDAAKILTKKTGQTWTPAEVQETVWSWAKTLYERRDRAGEYRTAQQILKAADMTHEDVISTPDFAVLLTRGIYRKILEGGNYADAIAALEKSRGGDGAAGRPSGPSVSVTGAEGSGFAQPAFERHLQRAAARLERVRTDRLTAKGVNPRELISDARDSEIAANMSAATNTIPGIAQLAEAANAGDESAARLVNLIAHESLERLVATVPDAKLEVSRNGGLYGGALEPSLGVKITFPEKRRAGILAALAKFAGNFNQEQIHVRQPTIDPVGRVYTDGSYATPVYTFELEAPLSRAEIEQVIADSGLYGLNFNEKKLEAYYVGDPRDEAARAEFGAAIERARDSLGERARSVGRSVARLWAYGIGDGATLGYDAIAGDVPRGASEHTEVPRAIAERQLGREIEPAEQEAEITPAQRQLQATIADHYENLPDNDMANPDVRRAYEELSKEIQKQFAALPVKVEVWDRAGEPYKSSSDLRRDVLDNNHMWIYGTSTDTFGPPGADFNNHPLLKLTGRLSDNGYPLVVNDELRAVHDYYAHIMSPTTFGPRGEEAAWKNHLATIDNPWARWALTSETRGQNSWVNFGAHVDPASKLADRPFARQKAALLPVEHMLTGNEAIDGPTDEFIRTMPDYSRNGSLPRSVNDPFADFSPRVPSALREKLIRKDPAYKAMFEDAKPKKQVAIGKLPEVPKPVVELPPPAEKEPRRRALQPIEGTGGDRFRAINGALYNVGEEQPQLDRAARMVDQDPEKALRIAMLEERAPAGVHPEFIFMALEEKAMLSQDVALQERLSQSRIAEEATTMGQRIAAWRNRAELSPVDDMRRIREAREARAKARGIDSNAKIETVVEQAQAFTRRTAKSTKRGNLQDFITSIVCKT